MGSICITNAGSRAGDPLGDLVSSFLVCKVLLESVSVTDRVAGVIRLPRVETDFILGPASIMVHKPKLHVSC